MGLVEYATANPLVIAGLCLVLLLGGIFLGFFFRRRASEEAASEILATPQFIKAAQNQKEEAFRDPKFIDTVRLAIVKDVETQREIIKVVVCSKEFADMIGDVVDHKKRRQAAEESAQLDLRFERLRSEISQNVREQMGASQSMLLSEIREAIKAISEVGNKLDSHIKVEAAIEQERKDAHK